MHQKYAVEFSHFYGEPSLIQSAVKHKEDQIQWRNYTVLMRNSHKCHICHQMFQSPRCYYLKVRLYYLPPDVAKMPWWWLSAVELEKNSSSKPLSRAEWFIILIKNIKTNISANCLHILVCLDPRNDTNLEGIQNEADSSKFCLYFGTFWTIFFQSQFAKNLIGEHPVFSLLIKWA